MIPFSLQREMVRKILEQARSYTWTLQGFGMLRLNLGREGRIHVWDDRYAVDSVSTIHTHPWDLQSTIISGTLANQRFGCLRHHVGGATHTRSIIATGEGGGLIPESDEPVKLVPGPVELYHAGDCYTQEADEIHESRPLRGCVTVMRRPKGAPLERAFVFYPYGTPWVSAEPRPATWDEVGDITSFALENWK